MSLADHIAQAREGVEEVLRTLGLDLVEAADGLAAGFDGGGQDAGPLGLADIVVGVADAGPEDVVDGIGIALGNPQFVRRAADRRQDRPVRLHQRPAEDRHDQINVSATTQFTFTRMWLRLHIVPEQEISDEA
jgi:hypothetical protein